MRCWLSSAYLDDLNVGHIFVVGPRAVHLVVAQPLQVRLHVAEDGADQFGGSAHLHRQVARLLGEDGRMGQPRCTERRAVIVFANYLVLSSCTVFTFYQQEIAFLTTGTESCVDACLQLCIR